MAQQMQLFEAIPLHRNGNTTLNVMLSRVSHGSLNADNAKIYCRKIGILSVHDIKDILEMAKVSQIPPAIIDLLLALPCKNHEILYQKALTNLWINRSFDAYFSQSKISSAVYSCCLISDWKNKGLVEISHDVLAKMWRLMVNASPQVIQAMRTTPSMVTFFLDTMSNKQQPSWDLMSGVVIANVLNQIGDILSEKECKTAQVFFEKFGMWESLHCENIYEKSAQIQNQKIQASIAPNDRPISVRKI